MLISYFEFCNECLQYVGVNNQNVGDCILLKNSSVAIVRCY